MMSEEIEIQTTTDKTLEERVGKLEVSFSNLKKRIERDIYPEDQRPEAEPMARRLAKIEYALFSDEQDSWSYREIQRILDRTDLHQDMENCALLELPERVGNLEKKVASLESETVSQSWRAPTRSEKEPLPRRALRLTLELAQILRTLDERWSEDDHWLKQGIVESLAEVAGMEVVAQ